MKAIRHLRVARPVSDLERARQMYCDGLGLQVIGSFRDHAGFDGIMLGIPGAHYHLEFTHCGSGAVRPSSTPEDLIVFYLPAETDWEGQCASMCAAGFTRVPAFNPYWDARGRTFEDADGYRVVLQREHWPPANAPQAS
jgi:catechol 2,3-dioxygenase-like lactoylglutathione lyase family enzyme